MIILMMIILMMMTILMIILTSFPYFWIRKTMFFFNVQSVNI